MQMQATLEAVTEPARRRIMELLVAGERPVGELVAELSMSQPAVSRHLRVLREAGLVAARTDAQRRLYRVQPAPLAALDAWLEPYRQMWAASLEALAAHLDVMDDDEQEEHR